MPLYIVAWCSIMLPGQYSLVIALFQPISQLKGYTLDQEQIYRTRGDRFLRPDFPRSHGLDARIRAVRRLAESVWDQSSRLRCQAASAARRPARAFDGRATAGSGTSPTPGASPVADSVCSGHQSE